MAEFMFVGDTDLIHMVPIKYTLSKMVIYNLHLGLA